MSAINIKRAVDNIRAKITIYTPITEAIVNSIQAIESSGITNGEVRITLTRNSRQLELEEAPIQERKIESITIEDNGIGFDDINRDSFDELYSEHKAKEGGKGFGRLTFLKYFEDVSIRSIYQTSNGIYWERNFRMGKDKSFIVDENKAKIAQESTGTTLVLSRIKKKTPFSHSTHIVARTLVEALLPYFLRQEYTCPKIILKEEDDSAIITLNDYLSSPEAVIQEVNIKKSKFELSNINGNQEFTIRLFKIFSPGTKVSRISLVAHNREVEATSLHKHIPEFEDEFFEPSATNSTAGRNFIVKAYVFGSYLDDNVSLERGGFLFKKEPDETHTLCDEISQLEIEIEAATLAKSAFEGELNSRSERKKAIIEEFVDNQAPWHRLIYKSADLRSFPMHPTPTQIDSILHAQKYNSERKLRDRVRELLDKDAEDEVIEDTSSLLAKEISESSKSELVHYVALRKHLLDILEKRLEYRDDGKHHTEAVVHDIIFPRKKDTDCIPYSGHNLWILDERLSFTSFTSSDQPLNGGNTDRSDIIAYGRRIAMRGENITSNPVTIFEFKRPGRDDFADPSSTEDPIAQIIRYAIRLREGNFKTPKGRPMQISEKTPFYGYVICDFNAKIERWLKLEKGFKPMPDHLGWFDFQTGANIYIEVLSWNKVVNDAVLRNKVFFHKLGIE